MTLAAFALMCVTAGPLGPASPAVEQATGETMHEGTVVSVGPATLVMADTTGKQFSHHVADTVQVTINGKLAKLADLKVGMRIRAVTNKADEVTVVTTIDDVKLASLAGRSARETRGP